MNALSIHNVTKTYASGTQALKGVSLEIPQGDFFALLGPNGAGKSTLIGTITQLVSKTSGTISIQGFDTDTHQEDAKACIGLVPQELNFNIFETPMAILVNQAGYYGIPRSVAVPRAEKLLQDLGIGDKAEQKSMSLSGGMKRRLLIARALMHRPQVLILDEPTAGVDVELRRSMWEYLKTLTAEGVTIVLTTHYLEEAEQLCKHTAIINKGVIVRNGLTADLMKESSTGRLEDIFIELTK
jgi:ABC-2 type transport system ATP-binding protein